MIEIPLFKIFQNKSNVFKKKKKKKTLSNKSDFI